MSARSFTAGSSLAFIAAVLGIGACSSDPDRNAVTDAAGVAYSLARDNFAAKLDLNPADFPDMPLARRTKPRKEKDPNAVERPAHSFDLKTRTLFRSPASDRPAASPKQGRPSSRAESDAEPEDQAGGRGAARASRSAAGAFVVPGRPDQRVRHREASARPRCPRGPVARSVGRD